MCSCWKVLRIQFGRVALAAGPPRRAIEPCRTVFLGRVRVEHRRVFGNGQHLAGAPPAALTRRPAAVRLRDTRPSRASGWRRCRYWRCPRTRRRDSIAGGGWHRRKRGRPLSKVPEPSAVQRPAPSESILTSFPDSTRNSDSKRPVIGNGIPGSRRSAAGIAGVRPLTP